MSEKRMITIIDALTKEVIERELTSEEVVELQELADAIKLDKAAITSQGE
jgi:hypothetical protein